MVRIGLHNRWMKSPLLLCFKGLLGPFCFCSKRYLIPFCRMQKGISYRLQNPKKSAKIKVYCMRCSITLWQFAKRAQITFGAVAKGNLLPVPFWLLCMRSPRIACNADHVLPYRWKKISKNIKMEGRLKNLVTIRGSYTYPIQPYHFQVNQIWCDGTFKDTEKFPYFSYFFLITYPQAHNLQSIIYCFKDEFYFAAIISFRSTPLWEKGRIRIRTSFYWIREA